MNSKKQTFESSLTALEKIVRQLEEGDLQLEESLKLFEDGVRLSRECRERLNQAERRIEILLKDEDGNAMLQTINDEESPQPLRESKSRKRIIFDDDDESDDEAAF